jgi:hypothetical protein
VHDVGGCKIIFSCPLRLGLMRRLAASDSPLISVSKLQGTFLRSFTACRKKANSGRRAAYCYSASLAGRYPGAKSGICRIRICSQSLCFGFLERFGAWGAVQARRNQIRRAPEYQSIAFTSARRFDFLGFTSIFRMLSLSPRRKRAAAPD